MSDVLVFGSLAEIETVMEAEIHNFMECLRLIKSRKLYLETHTSWESYCRERWGISPDAADRKIGQAIAILSLPDGADTPSQASLARQREPKVTPRVAGLPPVSPDAPGGNLTMVEVIEVEVTYDEPVRPDTPKLGAIIAGMRSVNPDVAGTLADGEQYHEVISWCRAFQDAYRHMHKPTTDDVVPNFKTKKP